MCFFVCGSLLVRLGSILLFGSGHLYLLFPLSVFPFHRWIPVGIFSFPLAVTVAVRLTRVLSSRAWICCGPVFSILISRLVFTVPADNLISRQGWEHSDCAQGRIGPRFSVREAGLDFLAGSRSHGKIRFLAWLLRVLVWPCAPKSISRFSCRDSRARQVLWFWSQDQIDSSTWEPVRAGSVLVFPLFGFSSAAGVGRPLRKLSLDPPRNSSCRAPDPECPVPMVFPLAAAGERAMDLGSRFLLCA